MARDIPGFYYDEDKKKYFKIQPNHVMPGGSVYSADRIKRRKIQDEAASALSRTQALRRGEIRRAPIIQDSLLGGPLVREYGNPGFQDAAVRSYTQGWEAREIKPSELFDASVLHMYQRSRVRNETLQPLNSSTLFMAAFDFDPVTRSLFCPVKGQNLYQIPEGGQPWPIEEKHSKRNSPPIIQPVFRYNRSTMLSIGDSHISSVTINPASRLILTTWQRPAQGQNALLIKLVDTEGPLEPGLLAVIDPAATARLENGSGSAPTIWTATHGAPGSMFNFAIACEDGMYLIIDEMNPHKWKASTGVDLLAVECLSHAPTVVLAGARDGLIKVLDVRVPHERWESGFNIRHPSAVTNIKHINGNTILVAGLNSTLCNYDLRYTKPLPQSTSWPNLGIEWKPPRGAKAVGPGFSRPVLTYPEHSNSAHIGLGFDIDAEAGIAAAVQDDTNNTVKIFSLKSGEAIRTLDATHEGSSIDTANVKAVRFVQDRKDWGMKSLWVAKGTKVIRYAW